MSMHKIGIVILNYNNWQDTLNCIDSIIEYCPASSYKIAVVDNASSNDSATRIAAYRKQICGRMPDLTFAQLNLSENTGYARGNNAGIRHFEDDDDISHILVLNNDVLLYEDIITPLVGFIENNHQAGLVTPLVYGADGKCIDQTCARRCITSRQLMLYYLVQGRDTFNIITNIKRHTNIIGDDLRVLSQESVEIDMPSGACFMIAKDKFKSIDYFDSNTFLYCEEDILYAKTSNAGWQNYMLPQIGCIHLGGCSTGAKIPSRFILECSVASRLYYLKTYASVSEPFLLLMRFLGRVYIEITVLKSFLKKQKQ